MEVWANIRDLPLICGNDSPFHEVCDYKTDTMYDRLCANTKYENIYIQNEFSS
jgi:hypothetical protein